VDPVVARPGRLVPVWLVPRPRIEPGAAAAVAAAVAALVVLPEVAAADVEGALNRLDVPAAVVVASPALDVPRPAPKGEAVVGAADVLAEVAGVEPRPSPNKDLEAAGVPPERPPKPEPKTLPAEEVTGAVAVVAGKEPADVPAVEDAVAVVEVVVAAEDVGWLVAVAPRPLKRDDVDEDAGLDVANKLPPLL
jgi:hypothetical protein